MAYLQTQSTNRRAMTVAAVAALHGVAIVALISAFSATVWETVDTWMPTTNYKAEPPPSPEPTVEPSQPVQDSKVFAPKPLIDIEPGRDAVVLDLTPIPAPSPIPSAGVRDAIPLPQPSPSASFTPKAAVPLGNPGKWASSDDYPPRALRDEREGMTRFRVTIGADGRVRNCEVTASSGSADLDRATCENVAKRARFRPATDATGAIVAGSYSNAIRWVIPD